MTAGDDQGVSKRGPVIPVYLSENMKVARLVEVLERLPFNSREEGRLVIDRVTRNFLVSACRTAAGDPDQTIHDALARRGAVRR